MGSELVVAKNILPEAETEKLRKFVTMRLDSQLFGLPVETVQDVLRPHSITPIPLASSNVAGLINLRGRIVTVIDMRTLMGLDPSPDGHHLEIVVEQGDDLYSLIVDAVEEVLTLPASQCEPPPSNLSPRWHDVAAGIYRLEHELMVVLNVDALFAHAET